VRPRPRDVRGFRERRGAKRPSERELRLLDVANAMYAPADDFNGTARTGVLEAGAYT
jgi:hypothetical protein